MNNKEHEQNKLTPEKIQEIFKEFECKHRAESPKTGLRSPQDAMKEILALRKEIELLKQEDTDESK